MKTIPKRINERLIRGIKKFQKIIDDAKARDINESDTVLIITDILNELFGFDKYSEITSEYEIRGTYCDLATKIDGTLQYLVEVKAIGNELKDQYIKQAVDYAANEGIDWVILTNSMHWIIYRIVFAKPITKEQVVEFDFSNLSSKNKQHLEILFSISKEGCTKSVLDELHSRRQILSKYFIASVIMSDPIIGGIRKELRKIAPDVKTDDGNIKKVISLDIFKREIIESEKTKEAEKKISREIKKQQRAKAKAKIKKQESEVGIEQKEDSLVSHNNGA